MANFNITIPDELLPAIEAEYSLVQGSTMATNAQEYFAASVVETVRQRAELYKVGPYYVGPINPQFRQDGKPYGYVEPAPEPEWEWPETAERFDVFTAPDGSQWIYDQPRNADGTYLADDPETEEVESALQWIPSPQDNDSDFGES